jgi:uncharacterized protein
VIIYHESKAQYLTDVDTNVLKTRLTDAFRAKTGSVPSDSYVWADEYSRFAMALNKANVDNNIDVAIEYHISSAGRFRVDVLLAGSDGTQDNALIIELKAWEDARVSDVENLVVCPARGRPERPHPCVQALKYKGLILRFNQDVRQQRINVEAAAYLFNLRRRQPEPLEDERYRNALAESQLFLADDVAELRAFIEKLIPKKATKDIIYIIDNGKLLPTDELVARVSSMLEGNEEFDLIDEQEVSFQVIKHALLEAKGLTRRHVFVVEGGPGTGKSVVAVRLLAEVLKAKRMGFFIAPNRAFRETIIESLTRGNRGYRDDGEALFRSSWTFHDVDFDSDARNDVFIVDEAHRLKDKAHMYRGTNMVRDMVRASRISVFLLDETQRVSWNDIGSVSEIRKAAAEFTAEFHEPFQLKAQFRCGGSNGYMNWLDDVLQIRETANFDNWGEGQYEFKIFERAEDLYAALTKNDRNKARLIAGYSWEWPARGRQRGTTAKHVEADALSLPWNFDGENWATGKDAITQVGCVHTSQGVEFDWLGVLIGPDLVYENNSVLGKPEARAKTDVSLKGWKKAFREAAGDRKTQQEILDKVQAIIKSTYKVLLSRGRKGCYLWCADAALREYFKRRLSLVSQAKGSSS